jgi:hypothetical protein
VLHDLRSRVTLYVVMGALFSVVGLVVAAVAGH